MLLHEIRNLYENNSAFNAWFKGSKVVDEHGNPLKVYHGANADIQAFNHQYIGKGLDQFGPGFYFTTQTHTASGYADTKKDNAVVYPVYLNIKNPLNANFSKRLTKLQIKKFLINAPNIDQALENYGDVDYEGYNKVFNEALNTMFEYQNDTLLKTLHTINNDFYQHHDSEFLYAVSKILKYDGIQVDFNDEKFYIAFFPNQIKSIFNTNYSKSEHIGESY